jgi:hypothetical protein
VGTRRIRRVVRAPAFGCIQRAGSALRSATTRFSCSTTSAPMGFVAGRCHPGAEVGPSQGAQRELGWRAYFLRFLPSVVRRACLARESKAPFCGSGD